MSENYCPIALHKSDAKGGIGLDQTTEYFADLLGFARVEGKWCFAVKKVKRASGFFEGDSSCHFEKEYEESSPVALLKQSRNLRVNALEVIPEFLEQILDHVTQKVEKLTDVSEKLNS